MSEFLVVSSTFARAAAARHSARRRPARRLRRADAAPAAAWPSANRSAARRRSRPPTCRCSSISRWCSSPASICRRCWSSGSSTSRGCSDEARVATLDVLIENGRRLHGHRPWPRALVDADGWQRRRRRARRRRADAARRSGASRHAVHMAVVDEGRRSPSSASTARTGDFPRVGAGHAPAIRLERAIARSLRPRRRKACPTRGPGSTTAAGACSHPLGRRRGRRRPCRRAAYALPAGRGREPAPDPGRPGACRHHRARPFPLHRERRDRRAAGGAARLRPQGHRRPDGRRRSSPRPRGSPAAPPATRPSPMPSPSPAPSRRRSASRRRRAPSGCAR